MARIDGDLVINRPVDEVFDFVAEERNEPRYNPRIRRAEKLSPGPIGPKTRFHAEAVTLGRTVGMTRLASSIHMAAADIVGTLRFDPVPTGTRMGWSWEMRLRGLYKLLTPIIAGSGRRQERANWAGLKRFLEGQASRRPSATLTGSGDEIGPVGTPVHSTAAHWRWLPWFDPPPSLSRAAACRLSRQRCRGRNGRSWAQRPVQDGTFPPEAGPRPQAACGSRMIGTGVRASTSRPRRPGRGRAGDATRGRSCRPVRCRPPPGSGRTAIRCGPQAPTGRRGVAGQELVM